MNDYSQPDFYRFNEDSLKLVNWILEKKLNAKAILDLGAGCGIIGIELANRMHADSLTMVELQADYKAHLEKNIDLILDKKIIPHISIQSFKKWTPNQLYDLIVCNPPYFLPGHGEVSKDA